ncbi:hypothetical protein LTR33_006827 [Friedmanniomyces endolithicus]|nr:hypothetical protein LTR33_006827 [Friedmanniomyces endolithicus]
MAFIANWAIDKVQTTAAGYLKTGLQAGGNMAGNAVGGVGTLIESSGRSLGEGKSLTIRPTTAVGGGIKGVGGYIGNYGDGIKGSMAADGPVNSAQKKTAVQPSTKGRITELGDVQRGPPAARKALPAAGGAPRPVGAGGAAKPPPVADGKTRVSAASRPRPAAAGAAAAKPMGAAARAKPQSNAAVGAKPAAKAAPDGKFRVAAASRPKPMVK